MTRAPSSPINPGASRRLPGKERRRWRASAPSRSWFSALALFLLFAAGFGEALAGIEDIGPPEPFVAEPYVPPPPRVSKVHLKDNGDGTLTDLDSGVMWAQADSYAELGHCLTWHASVEYVKRLRTGGHDDWQLPTLVELYSIYDDTKANIKAWDRDPDNPLALDEKFADGAAYWYWSADHKFTDLSDCCAHSFYFVQGMAHIRRFSYCQNGGVRAIRRPAAAAK